MNTLLRPTIRSLSRAPGQQGSLVGASQARQPDHRRLHFRHMTSSNAPHPVDAPEVVAMAAARVQAHLHRVMPEADAHPTSLHEAMRYTVFGGGKRLRPALVYAGGRLSRVKPDVLDPAAAAVELIHAYSLVHDDLPAMDDDELRHGQPTVHVRYGEATAVLVGDALQALAFEVIACNASPTLARHSMQLLAAAAGAAGMVGGQVLDLAAEDRTEPLPLADLEAMHRRKTGALIRASIMLGASAGPLGGIELDAVDAFAREIGLAFQIHDDVLDVVASTERLGKPQGSDERQGKTTYVTILGLAGAREEGRNRLDSALTHLARFGTRADDLRAIARYIVGRRQ